jgi:hypothetical protein
MARRPVMAKKYRVTLPTEEREELERLLARGKAAVRKIKRAQVLLKADETEGGPRWPDERIAEAVGGAAPRWSAFASALSRRGSPRH